MLQITPQMLRLKLSVRICLALAVRTLACSGELGLRIKNGRCLPPVVMVVGTDQLLRFR